MDTAAATTGPVTCSRDSEPVWDPAGLPLHTEDLDGGGDADADSADLLPTIQCLTLIIPDPEHIQVILRLPVARNRSRNSRKTVLPKKIDESLILNCRNE